MQNTTTQTTKPLIVGVGASAGGLEAFQELLSSIGDNSNLAIVFVQHLDPTSESLLAELLANSTSMNVVQISGRLRLKAGTVFVCPPQTLLDLDDGFVSIANRGSSDRPATPIDHFFHCIAEDQGDRGIGVILSGAGSDGTLGLKAISDRGGLTFAQDAVSAKYDSMPRSAATTGVADHILSPSRIAAELLQYAGHLSEIEEPAAGNQMRVEIKEAIPVIAERLLDVTDHNFQHYKLNTLTRRIQRRMQVLKIAGVSEYVDRLQHGEDEVRLLFRELLIGVTAFFRDPDAFESVRRNVLPKLFENRTSDDCLRIWVAGCASGQEAYTMAILCREIMDEICCHDNPNRESDGLAGKTGATLPSVQIFATDIDERALQVAREGAYPVGIEEQVSPERLARFFVKRGKKYHVSKEIRELVLFSVHNLISDPPFSRQDLISCRNLLIYLGPHLQNKLIPLFHHALRPSGYLFLGPSENITSHGELFRPLDAKQRISQRKGTAIGASGASQYRPNAMVARNGGQLEPDSATDLTEMRQRITLDEFAPKSVVIDEAGQIRNASADMQKYLTVSGGNYQNNIIKMAARGLRLGLRAAIAEAKKIRRRVDHENLSLRVGDQIQRVMLTVQPMPRLGEDEALFLVVFQDVGKPFKRDDAGQSVTALPVDLDDDAIVTQLERELETTRDDLDKTLQDMEATNEELKSSNEELLSMNEELQSANEELETSREEIRAGSDAVARANADLENLLRSTQIATVFLDEQLHIRSFTPAITDIYSLIPADVGRPLEHFVPLAPRMPPLPDPTTIRSVETEKNTVIANSGKVYIRRVLPYLSQMGQSEGIVVTFTDVSELHQSKEKYRATFDNAAVGIAHVGLDGKWLHANDRLCEIVGYRREDLLRKSFQEITHPDDLNDDTQQVERLISGESDFYAMEKRYIRPDHSTVWARLTVSMIRNSVGEPVHFISIVEDIADAKRIEAEREQSRRDLELSKKRLDLAMEAMEMASWGWDMETNQVIAGDHLKRRFGFDPQESPSVKDFLARIDESDRERVTNGIRDAIENDCPYEEEYRVHHPSGETRWLRARGRTIRLEDGTTDDFFGVVVDITARKQRELDLADREAHLRRVINNQLGLVGVIDRDGILLEVDDRSLEIARSRREEVIGKHFADAPWWNYDPAVADQMRHAMQRAFAGEVVRYDVSLFAHGDDGVMIDFMIAPVNNQNGEVEFLVPSGVDIRDRKLSELALRNTATRLEVIFESAVDGIITINSHGTINSANRAAQEIFGYDLAEMVGENVRMLMPEPDHSQNDGYLAAYADTGEHRIIVNQREVRGKRKDGVTFPLDLSVSETSLEGEHCFVGIVRDISERVFSENAIKDTSKRMEMALRAGGMAAWEWTPEESFWTKELYELMDISVDQVASTELFFTRVHPDDIDDLKLAWQEAVDGNDAYDCEFRVQRPDGTVRWMMGLGEVVRNNAGNVVRMYGLNWDSTQEHEYAAALQESERRALEASAAKSAFLANMSHEIRTPMTAILGYADLIRDLIDNPEAIGHLGTIQRNGDYLLEIINDILDLSKIEAGKLEVEKERFQPARLIEDVRSVMEVRATEGGLSLQVEYDAPLPKVIESDAKRLKQILINLVGNAIKFTKRGGVRIRVKYDRSATCQKFRPSSFGTDTPREISSFATGGQLHFDIVDTGIGMSDEQMDRLFKPFSQGDSSVSRHFGGTGLGLAISKRLAGMLGGEIVARSTQDVGSTFTLSISVGDVGEVEMINYAEATSDGESNVRSDSVPSTLNCHILIVDDRRDIRFLSKRLLTKEGATVDECEDGQFAVDYVTNCLNKSNCPDLILLDMQMPNLDGYETARVLRKLGYARPIIALTADAMQGDMNQCLAAGCNDYLSKPIDAKRMIALVSELTNKASDK